MNVRNLYPEQFEELRELLIFEPSYSHLAETLCICDDWTDEDRENWAAGKVTDELVIKSFDGICFVCDDFGCTAFQYDKYPDKED